MRISNAIHIDAPTDVVWAVTAAIERWPERMPAMRSYGLTRSDER